MSILKEFYKINNNWLVLKYYFNVSISVFLSERQHWMDCLYLISRQSENLYPTRWWLGVLDGSKGGNLKNTYLKKSVNKYLFRHAHVLWCLAVCDSLSLSLSCYAVILPLPNMIMDEQKAIVSWNMHVYALLYARDSILLLTCSFLIYNLDIE